MTNEQSSELADPGVGSFDDPAAFVAAQLAAIFIAPVAAVASVGTINSMPRFFSRSRSGSES
jgi:hypothetical protein